MGEGPNPNGKHSKYSIEDGKLIRKETCPEPNCPGFSWRFTKIASRAVSVDIPSRTSNRKITQGPIICQDLVRSKANA